MNKLALAIIFIASFKIHVSANTGDTTVIIAHSLTNLNSPPSNDDVWVSIPNTSVSYQKILMKLTLGCGTPNCSGWDYTVNASLGKKSGTLDSTIVAIDTLTHDTTWSFSDHVNFIEVGRLITPYGTYMAAGTNGYNNSWTHPYYYDVTDYASLLKDSVNVRVHYDGWTDAFSAKIEFIFIEGSPSREVEAVKEIYNTYISYPNSTDFENVAVPKTFPISVNVTSAKVTVIMTGHGSQGEFDPHYFHILINGSEVYSHILWKEDCDINAVAPQGGTWIFSRANWCPGDKVPIYEADITPYITPGQNVTVDLDFDDFAIQGNSTAGYGVSAYLVTYSSQKNNDAMMEEIIAPNNDKPYAHWNPISTKPKVKIKNTGKQNLNYAEISYWVNGGNKCYYEWSGSLAPFESEQITLPAFDWNGLDTNNRVFYAEVKWPNQFNDEYTPNNLLASNFNMSPQMDSVFKILFKTNNQPWENKYLIKNENGDTLVYRNGFTAINTNHYDTIHLTPGSYSFDFYDFDSVSWGCGDGLKFFLNQQDPPCPISQPCYESTGQLKFLRTSNALIKNFNPELGSNVHYEFTVGYPLGYNPAKAICTAPIHNTGLSDLSIPNTTMTVFPNPASELINIKIDSEKETPGKVELSDLQGKGLKLINLEVSQHHQLTLPTSQLSRGIYVLRYSAKGVNISKKIILQ